MHKVPTLILNPSAQEVLTEGQDLKVTCGYVDRVCGQSELQETPSKNQVKYK